MLNNLKFKFIYLLEVFWLLLLLIYASMIYLNHQLLGVFNSDWLMFFNFFKDLFLNNGHYKDWVISPAPHFFPDMFIFFPFFFLVKNIYFQFLTVTWLMIILTYLSIRIIYGHFFTKLTTIFALTATSSLFLLAFKNKYPYILTLVPAVHIGEFIAGLFLLGIQLILINNKFDYKTYLLCVASGIIAFGAGVSDLLFLVQFAFPIFLAYGFLWKNEKIKFHFALFFSSIVVIFASLGASITKYLVPKDILLDYLAQPAIKKISVKGIIVQLHQLLKLLENINNHEVEIIMGVFYFFIICILIMNYFDFNKIIKIYLDTKIIFLSVFILSSIFLNVVIFCFFDNPANVIDRYILTFYFFPFLLFFFPMSCFKHHSYMHKIMIYLSFLVFIYILTSMYLLFHKTAFKIHMNYYPADIRCIDKALRGYGHYGIAQYWDANFLTSLSKEDLQILPVKSDLSPFYWSVNIKKFKNPISFVILDSGYPTSLKKEIIYAKYGIPEKEVSCYARKILLYPLGRINL